MTCPLLPAALVHRFHGDVSVRPGRGVRPVGRPWCVLWTPLFSLLSLDSLLPSLDGLLPSLGRCRFRLTECCFRLTDAAFDEMKRAGPDVDSVGAGSHRPDARRTPLGSVTNDARIRGTPRVRPSQAVQVTQTKGPARERAKQKPRKRAKQKPRRRKCACATCNGDMAVPGVAIKLPPAWLNGRRNPARAAFLAGGGVRSFRCARV